MRQAPRSPLSFKLQRVANVPEHPPPSTRLMSCAHIANRQLSRIIGARNARGRRHPATQNNIKETTSSAYIVADASDLFVVWLRSNSKAAIPHATVGTAAPTTNIRTETNTAWVTCARTTASSLEMAAIISATQARNPITLRAIRAVINRCPMGDTPYRASRAIGYRKGGHRTADPCGRPEPFRIVPERPSLHEVTISHPPGA